MNTELSLCHTECVLPLCKKTTFISIQIMQILKFLFKKKSLCVFYLVTNASLVAHMQHNDDGVDLQQVPLTCK